MSLFSWFRTSHQAGKSARDRQCFRPKVEAMEERVVPAPLLGTGALNDHTVLLLGSSLNPSAVPATTSIEAVELTARGYTVEIATDAQWQAKSAANFASYRALVIGDRRDSSAALAGALPNVNTWTSVINGQEFLTGADPEFHAQEGSNSAGATLTIQKGVDFAAATPGRTGLYFAFGADATGSIQTVLNQLGSGFTVARNSGNNVHVVAPTTPGLTALTDSVLTGWESTYHRAITHIPTTFTVFAVDASNDVIVIRQNLDLTPQFTISPFIFTQTRTAAGLRGFGFATFTNNGADIVGDFTINFSAPQVNFLLLQGTGQTVKAVNLQNGHYSITFTGGLKHGQAVGVYSQFS